MTRILLSGYYGFENAGDEAILAGILASFQQLDPSVSFTVISGRRRVTAERFGVEAVSRDDFRAIWRAAGSADLILSGGGSLLQDVTSLKSLFYYLAVLTMAKSRRKPAMIYAQGIGPIMGPIGRTMIRSVCNRLDAITVRDPDSAALLGRLGVRRPPVTVTADPAIALGAGDADAGRALLRAGGVDGSGPLIGVSVRNWQARDARFVPSLAQALDELAQRSGGHVLFFPMQVGSDVRAAETVRTHMRAPATVLTAPYGYQEVRNLVAALDLVIGLRFHALVFAATSGTPMVGLSYDPKNDSFLRSIGLEASGSTDQLVPENVVKAGMAALEQAGAMRSQLLQRVGELAGLSRENARIALRLIEEWR